MPHVGLVLEPVAAPGQYAEMVVSKVQVVFEPQLERAFEP